jgi:ElaB/YqjD/DUF883 family membrane-anchored ribosome-binding protein
LPHIENDGPEKEIEMPTTKKTTAAKPAAKKPATARKITTKPKIDKQKAASKTSVATAKANPGKAEPTNMKDEFTNLKSQAGDKARDAANRGKDRAAEALGGIGKIIRESADTIDEKVGAQYGDYARSAADAVDGFAGKVDSKQLDDIVEEARQFVRKSPAVAIGAAAAIGFVLARIVRSGRDA